MIIKVKQLLELKNTWLRNHEKCYETIRMDSQAFDLLLKSNFANIHTTCACVSLSHLIAHVSSAIFLTFSSW